MKIILLPFHTWGCNTIGKGKPQYVLNFVEEDLEFQKVDATFCVMGSCISWGFTLSQNCKG